MRLAMLAVVLLASPLVSMAAQDSSVLTAGQRVRITAPTIGLDGQVASVGSVDDGMLTATAEGPLRIPLRNITRLEVSRGQKSRWGKGALYGLVGGAVVGVGIGLLACEAYEVLPSGNCFDSNDGGQIAFWGPVAISVLAGPILGAAVGALVRTEMWEAVPLEGLRVTLTPGSEGVGVGVGAILRF